MTTAVQLAQSVAPGVSLGFKNRIINGGMVINQRGVTSGVTSGYFVDRWALSGCSTSSTLSSSLPAGFSSGISITATSGNPIAFQRIESKNCSDLSGQSVTLSFYAKNISNATTLYASLAYANSADNFGATTTISEQNLGSLTSDWVRYSYTWSNLPSGSTNGLAVNILCAGTSTFSMGITGVQLEVGTAATSFEFRDYGRELMLCQRYFYRTIDPGASGVVSSSGNGVSRFTFYPPVPMRASPTLSASGTFAFWNGATTATSGSVVGIFKSSKTYGLYQLDFGSLSANIGADGRAVILYVQESGTNYIDTSAEL